MKYALSWLNDYATIKQTPEQLFDRLIMTTAEVEAVDTIPVPAQEALVAEIVKVGQHPNADRLHLVTITTARYPEVTVVCGAPNVMIGQKVPFIPESSHYQDQTAGLSVLKAATIRGVISKGMLASSRDLGLGEEHEGLLTLPASTKLTDSLAAVLGWQLPVVDLEITPNRGDLLSYVGISREIAFMEKTRLAMPPLASLTVPTALAKPVLEVEVQTKQCLRYTALVFDDVVNGPSPWWLQRRLLLSGMQPVNAVVDITNYVMLELGQPLHSFDFNLLAGRAEQAAIIVRQGHRNETLAALDHTAYTLTGEDITIANRKDTIALAGVIGGTETAVSESTTRIVIESAIFDPGSVRRSATRHGVRTESVTRFEKGIDPELPIIALKRAAYLLNEICQAHPIGHLVDIAQSHSNRPHIRLNLERAARTLGVQITKTQAKTNLSYLGFQITESSSQSLSVIPPSWRLDVSLEEDIYEELVRLIGYDTIPATLPSGPIKPVQVESRYYQHRRLREYLALEGLREIINLPFISETTAEQYQMSARSLEIANPTSRNEKYLRPSLVPALVENLIAASRSVLTVQRFEISHVFVKKESSHLEKDVLCLGLLTRDPLILAQNIKGILAKLPAVVERAGAITFDTSDTTPPCFQATVESVVYEDKIIGTVGVIEESFARRCKLRGQRSLVMAEIDLDPILDAPIEIQKFTPGSRFPSIVRDLSLTYAQTRVREALAVITAVKLNLTVDYLLLGTYVTAPDDRALTIRLTFQSDERTLTDEEVDQDLAILMKALANKHISLRK